MIESRFRDYQKDLRKRFRWGRFRWDSDSDSDSDEKKNRLVTKQPAPITANLEPKTQTLTPAFLPHCIRRPSSPQRHEPGLPNQLATDLLQMIAFAPIFLSHATRFAERLVKHRLCSMDKFHGSLTYQPSDVTHRFNLVARARSSVELSWSNVAKTQSHQGDKQPQTPGFTWKKLEIGGLGQRFAIENGRMRFFHDCGRCKPYCRHESGSQYRYRQMQMRQLWCSSRPLSTQMAIYLRIPYLRHPPQGCAAAISAYLAVALTCCKLQPGFNVRAVKRMSFCILRRVFNVRTGLQRLAQVTHELGFMKHTLASHMTSIKSCIKIC
jgi:hypothetical protein